MAGSASEDAPAIRPPATDPSPAVHSESQTSRSTPQPNAGFSSFQAINRMNEDPTGSRRQSRDASARGTPQAEGVTGQKQTSEAPAQNASKASAQGESTEASGSYGTRSRRTGNQRLNYAEDQDAEFEFTSAATTTSYKKGVPTANAQSATDVKRAKDSAQPVTTSSAHSSANNQTVAKDSTPGATSAATTNPKKRKAAGTATPTNHATIPPMSAGLPATNMRKQAPSSLARETNMLTFSKSKSCLNKKGELVADDGTKLNINGKRLALRPASLFRGALFAEVQALYPASPSHRRSNKITTMKCLRLTNYRSCLSGMRTARRALLPLPGDGVLAH